MTAPVLNYIAYEDFLANVRSLSRKLAADSWKADFIIGIGRGRARASGLYQPRTASADALDRSQLESARLCR